MSASTGEVRSVLTGVLCSFDAGTVRLGAEVPADGADDQADAGGDRPLGPGRSLLVGSAFVVGRNVRSSGMSGRRGLPLRC
jgi:hypothetical protein